MKNFYVELKLSGSVLKSNLSYMPEYFAREDAFASCRNGKGLTEIELYDLSTILNDLEDLTFEQAIKVSKNYFTSIGFDTTKK